MENKRFEKIMDVFTTIASKLYWEAISKEKFLALYGFNITRDDFLIAMKTIFTKMICEKDDEELSFFPVKEIENLENQPILLVNLALDFISDNFRLPFKTYKYFMSMKKERERTKSSEVF